MIWFSYEFLTFSVAYNWIKIITSYSIIEFAILSISIIFFLLLILYIIPIIKIYCLEREKEKIKLKNRKMLKRITLQKDIEDDIAEELKLVNN